MRNLPSFTVLCMFAFLIHKCTATCGPAEEGTEYNITCNNPSPDRFLYLQWEAVKGNVTIPVASCFDINSCNGYDPANFDVTVLEDSSTLTMKNVSRSEPFNMSTVWTCDWFSSGKRVNACESLEVYAKPEKVICGPPILNVSTYQIDVTCSTEKVYPRAMCAMMLSRDNVSFSSVYSSVTYNHQAENKTILYYKTTCTLVFSLDYLRSRGNYSKVRMYPTVSGGYNFGVESDTWRTELALVKDLPAGETQTSEDSGVATGLAVGLGLPLVIALCAVAVLAFLLFRKRQTFQTRRSPPELPKITGTSVLRRYDQVEASQGERENDNYEEVNFYDEATSASASNANIVKDDAPETETYENETAEVTDTEKTGESRVYDE